MRKKNKTRMLLALAVAVAAIGSSHAQDAALPKDISGRWTIKSSGRTQIFSIEDISVNADRTFNARLTWWTFDPRCLIRNEPLVGRMTPEGIAFDATTKCDVSFTVRLARNENDWVGTATTTSGTPVVLDLKAR